MKTEVMATEEKILKYGIGISWLTSWFLIIPISLIAIIVTIYKLAKRKSNLTKYAILLSPFLILPILNVGMGILDYTQGDAKLKKIGYPMPEFANINAEYRIKNQSLGCSYTGVEYLASFRYNQTVKFLIKKFGYQKMSYTGILPSKEEAKQLLLSDEYEIGKIEFENDDKIKITKESILSQINLNEQHPSFKKTIKDFEVIKNPKLRLVGNCLVAQINEKWIYLIELGEERFIAQYRI